MVLQVQRVVYQTQIQRYQNQIHDLIINGHVSRANDSGKDNIVMMLLRKTPPLKKMSFMSIPTILRRYRDDLLTQKDYGLGLNIHIID